MRIAPCLLGLVAMAAAVAALSQALPANKQPSADQMRQLLEDQEYWRSQYDRYNDIERRANSLRPQRRDGPLRELNITDNEIREVEEIARKYLPHSMVNISPVVTNCPCEEGPTCTAQVYVVAQTPEKTRDLQLSRMNDRWVVGVVQDWWLRREALVEQHTGNPMFDRYLESKALFELFEEFPVCRGQLVPAQQHAAATKTEGKK